MTMSKASSQYFEQVADQWDNLRSGYFTEAVRQTAISKAYLRLEMVVADVGAGTGYMAAGLAPLVRQVHVLDGSPAMIAAARRNLISMDHIVYHEADGQSLSLEDASIDVVFANMYLHHCPDPQASIREMVRVLKPGGRLVITDMDTHPYAWLKEEMSDEWMGFERDQIRSWFKEADLVNIIVDSTGQSCSSQSQNTATAEQERSANIGVFVATGTRRLSMREAVQNNYGLLAELGRSSSRIELAETFDDVSALFDPSCCGSTSIAQSCCTGTQYLPYQSILFATDYTVEDKAAIPDEAEEISLGCGNPIAMANLKSGEIVLDIGSGGGIDAFLASSRVGPAGRVIGVDMTPAMLDRARATAKRAGIENVEFRYGQAEKMPVDDGTIDVILSNCVINLCEDKGLVFQEAFRVLKPGGRLEVSDMVTGGPLPLEIRSKSNEWAGCVSGALPEPEYLDLIAQAGFTSITSRKSTSSGEFLGVPVYSAIVSARKP
jgi:arsenite methyltransferase